MPKFPQFTCFLHHFLYLSGHKTTKLMIEKTRGIVLHQTRGATGHLIVTIFTEDCGAVAFVVKPSRAKTQRLHTNLLRPLSIVDLIFDLRVNQSLQRIEDLHVGMAYRSLPYHPVKETIALFLGEFLYYSLRNETRNQPLFAFLCNSLAWLDACDSGLANFHLTLLLRLTRFLGFWPSVDASAHGMFFDMQTCQYTEVRPPHGAYLTPEEAGLMPLMMRMNFPSMHLFRMSREQRNRFLDILEAYYQQRIPGFPPLRSLQVLRDLLN